MAGRCLDYWRGVFMGVCRSALSLNGCNMQGGVPDLSSFASLGYASD